METIAIYLNGTYQIKNPTWHEEDAAWKAKHVYSMITRHSLMLDRIAEVGCGSGKILVELQARMKESVHFDGYEISPQGYALSAGSQNNRLHFHLKDLLTEEDTVYDLLLVIDVFEHVEDYMGFLRGMKGKAQNMIFHIPLDLSAQSVIRGKSLIDTRRKVGHLHYFTEETALATLESTGYEVVDYFLTARSLERRVPGMKSSLAWLPRKLLSILSMSMASKLLGGFSLMVLARPQTGQAL